MQDFAYKGEPHTCMWCGRKLREYFTEITGPGSIGSTVSVAVPPDPGTLYNGHLVRQVVALVHTRIETEWGLRTGRLRRTRQGEAADMYRVYYDPPRWHTWNAWSSEDAYFDTMRCAAQFGQRLAELGHRLTRASA